MECECKNWARTNQLLLTKHHKNCSKYDLEGDAKEIITALLNGIQEWASDEDGMHPDCWEAFKNASCFIFEVWRIKEGDEIK